MDEKTIQRWKLATIGCAEKLNEQSDRPFWVRDTIYDAWMKHLGPSAAFRRREPTPIPRESLDELCQTAFKLQMTIRRSGENYRCEHPPVKHPKYYKYEDIAEAMSAEGDDADKNDCILFTYFGALTKGRDREPGFTVLEKAWVVVGPPRG